MSYEKQRKLVCQKEALSREEAAVVSIPALGDRLYYYIQLR